MKQINFETLIKKLVETPIVVDKAVEIAMKKSAMKVRDTAVKKFGTYQPSVGEFPAWEELSINTVNQKMNRGAEGPSPLIGTYGADKYQEGNAKTQNKVWPAHLRNTIGTKVYGMVAAVGTDDPLGEYHEFGTKHIPPRPFLRPALYENGENIKNETKEAIAAAMMKI